MSLNDVVKVILWCAVFALLWVVMVAAWITVWAPS